MIPFFSIVIPCYEMKGFGSDFLRFNLKKIKDQKFTDYEIIVTDQSKDDSIKIVCQEFSNSINVKYISAHHLSPKFATNTNNGIKNSEGQWIKIICQDDYLVCDYSLLKLFENIKNNSDKSWISMSCFHSNDGVNLYRPFHPNWNERIIVGNNTLSSPTAICVKRMNTLPLFDENLEWLVDCEWYQRLFLNFGLPSFLYDFIVVNRTWGDRLSDNISDQTKTKEYEYVKNIYIK